MSYLSVLLVTLFLAADFGRIHAFATTRSMVGRRIFTSLKPHRIGYLENLSETGTETTDLPARPKLVEASLRQTAEAEAASDMKAYATAKEIMATRFQLEATSREKAAFEAAKAYTERSVKGLMATRFVVEAQTRSLIRKKKQAAVAQSLLASQLINMAKTNAAKARRRSYEQQRALLAARFAGKAEKVAANAKYAAIEDPAERLLQHLLDFDLLEGIYAPNGF